MGKYQALQNRLAKVQQKKAAQAARVWIIDIGEYERMKEKFGPNDIVIVEDYGEVNENEQYNNTSPESGPDHINSIGHINDYRSG